MLAYFWYAQRWLTKLWFSLWKCRGYRFSSVRELNSTNFLIVAHRPFTVAYHLQVTFYYINLTTGHRLPPGSESGDTERIRQQCESAPCPWRYRLWSATCLYGTGTSTSHACSRYRQSEVRKEGFMEPRGKLLWKNPVHFLEKNPKKSKKNPKKPKSRTPFEGVIYPSHWTRWGYRGVRLPPPLGFFASSRASLAYEIKRLPHHIWILRLPNFTGKFASPSGKFVKLSFKFSISSISPRKCHCLKKDLFFIPVLKSPIENPGIHFSKTPNKVK